MEELGKISYNSTNMLAFHTLQKQLGSLNNGKDRHLFLNYPDLDKYFDVYYYLSSENWNVKGLNGEYPF